MPKTSPVKNESVSKAPKLRGTVSGVSSEKTIRVDVDTLKTHPKYGKKYRSTKRYLVHSEEGSYSVGDAVSFVECRPISKKKRHIVVK